MVWSMSGLCLQLDAFGRVGRRIADRFAVSLLAGLDGGGEVVALFRKRGAATLDRVSGGIAEIGTAALEIVCPLFRFRPDQFASLSASLGGEQQSNGHPQSK